MKTGNWIGIAALLVAGLLAASCGSSTESPVGTDGVSSGELESAVRAGCAGTYATSDDCMECVDGVLQRVNERTPVEQEQISSLQALFHAGECPDGGISGEVEICHIPPGNPNNAHTITVSPNAVPAHLAHGDFEGPCEGECDQISCEVAGAECGVIDDGCGGTVDCGGCEDPETCGGGGEPNVCGTSALDCAAAVSNEPFIVDCTGEGTPAGLCAYDVGNSYLPFGDPTFTCETVCSDLGFSCVEAYAGDFSSCIQWTEGRGCDTPLSQIPEQPDLYCECGP